jgi:hypothetical protein
MAKATIKSRAGAFITIEGSEAEVSSILSVFERSQAVTHARLTLTKKQIKAKDERGRKSASDLITELRGKGFFDKAKGLGDVSKALEEGGFLYPITTLSGVMLGLVQKRVLRRKKTDGKWVYGK